MKSITPVLTLGFTLIGFTYPLFAHESCEKEYEYCVDPCSREHYPTAIKDCIVKCEKHKKKCHKKHEDSVSHLQ